MKALTAAGPALRRRLLTRPPIPDPAPVRSVAYRERPTQRIELYAPEGARGAPAAFVVHGGGFVGGSRTMPAVRVLIHDLLEQGFVVASIDYRLARPVTVRLADQVEDVRRAAAWWKGAAHTVGADLDRTVLIGLSAGGALSVLARDALPACAYIGIYGAFDLELLPAAWASASLLTGIADKARRANLNPLTHAAFDLPTLLVHGTADPLTPPPHAERFVAAREAAGLQTALTWVEGAHHGFLQEGLDHDHTRQGLGAIRAFLADHVLEG